RISGRSSACPCDCSSLRRFAPSVGVPRSRFFATMPNETTLIATIAIAFVGALLMGLLAARLRLPPIVGYLIAGIAMHALAPETVPISGFAHQASRSEERR